MRILIVEDNAIIAANLYDYLEARGHDVEASSDGQRAYQLAGKQRFDAILLDLGLPKLDGVELCRKLREEAGVETPVLVLTARDTLEDKLLTFANGADDYLVKPFALEEVEARLHALHRRSSGKRAFDGVLRSGKLVLDARSMRVSVDGAELTLPPKCVRLLSVLMGEPGRLFARHELEREIWGEEQDTSEKLRHHLHLLRRALVDAQGHDPITTVHGLGYRLEVADAKA